MLSQQTIDIVKATVPIIQEFGAKVTQTFYHNLLTENPALKAVFNQGNQASGHQSQALGMAVLAYAQHIETPQVLGPAIKHISQKHASLFVKPEQYAVVGKYLLDAFGQVLGDAFTPDVRQAWAEAYGQLADIMIGTEAEIYEKSEGWNDWRDFVVQKKTPESSEITSFALYPRDGQPLPPYLPGQYVSIRIHIPSLGYTQTRQYSLSDSHAIDHYRISVKKDPGVRLDDVDHPGLVSNVLHRTVEEGHVIQLSQPHGTFALDTASNPETPVVLISAGVGITPMISILNSVSAGDTPDRPVSWIHGANTSLKRAFASHIDRVANSNSNSNSNIRVSRFLTRPTDHDRQGVDYDHAGRVDLDKCDDDLVLFLNDKSTLYFACGPDTFMSAVSEQLLRKGVDKGRIQVERFGTGGF